MREGTKKATRLVQVIQTASSLSHMRKTDGWSFPLGPSGAPSSLTPPLRSEATGRIRPPPLRRPALSEVLKRVRAPRPDAGHGRSALA